MSNPVLHIKDSFYFELPKFLVPSHRTDKSQFPNVWVKNDDQFQMWEAERLVHELGSMAHGVKLPDEHDLIHDWEHWQHSGVDHQNFARPFDLFLELQSARLRADYNARYGSAAADVKKPTFDAYVAEAESHGEKFGWTTKVIGDPRKNVAWQKAKEHAGGRKAIEEFKANETIKWSEQKLAKYNEHLSGKIVLDPQPFGQLRNMYEVESGFCISKFMILEVVIAILLFAVFSMIASRFRGAMAPKGRFWNFFEVFLLFIRDQIARPAIGGGHHEEEHAADHGHAEHGHAADGHSHTAHGHGDHAHGKADAHHAAHHHVNEADRFVPLLWTIFFFVLGCNLFGMIPWLGSPTGSWGVTMALAAVTFATVWIAGMIKFGVIGFFLNQIPGMDLPWYMALFLKPMIFAIEMMGLFIKHLVLSIRLLANMVAGHLVILGLMGLAFGVEAAMTFSSPDVPGWLWWPVAGVTVLSATVFNVLELFVAFLQAYVFTFLSALFIGAAVHKH